MKKRALIVVLLHLVCLALYGCSSTGLATIPEDPSQLSDKIRQQIEDSWYKISPENLVWADQNDFYHGVRYYGTYKGWSVLFSDGGIQLAAISSIPVGHEVFGHSSSFQLYAFKNGSFLTLTEAYEKGYINSEAISAAAKLHRACERSFWEDRIHEYHEQFPNEPMQSLPHWATEPNE